MWFRPCIFNNAINVTEIIPSSVLQEKLCRSSLPSLLRAVERWGWRLGIDGEEEEEECPAGRWGSTSSPCMMLIPRKSSEGNSWHYPEWNVSECSEKEDRETLTGSLTTAWPWPFQGLLCEHLALLLWLLWGFFSLTDWASHSSGCLCVLHCL